MEYKWIWIALLVIISIGFCYVGYRADGKRSPIAFVRTVIEEFLGIAAALFFGSFGFRWDLFIEKNERNHSAEKD